MSRFKNLSIWAPLAWELIKAAFWIIFGSNEFKRNLYNWYFESDPRGAIKMTKHGPEKVKMKNEG